MSVLIQIISVTKYSLSKQLLSYQGKINIICKTSQAVDLWRYYDFSEPQTRIISTV